VHKVTVARQVLKNYSPSPDARFPTMHLPPRKAAARERFAHLIEHEVGNL
jgi:acyl-CoA dehydrogenase